MAARRATKAGGRLFVHGLTGGIASQCDVFALSLGHHKIPFLTSTYTAPPLTAGKTHACKVLQGLGARTLNADQVGHQCYLPGQPAHAAIKQAFGSGVLAPDGTVDRRLLGQLVFADPVQVVEFVPLKALVVLRISLFHYYNTISSYPAPRPQRNHVPGDGGTGARGGAALGLARPSLGGSRGGAAPGGQVG